MSPSFVDVAASSALLEKKTLVVTVNGREVCLVRVDGVAYGVDNLCPHRGGLLGSGDLSGHHLYCPLHAWAFDVRTGEGFFPKGASVIVYETQERDGRLYVGTIGRKPLGSTP